MKINSVKWQNNEARKWQIQGTGPSLVKFVRRFGRSLMGALPDGTTGPHVFVQDLQAPEFSNKDHHHLGRVLRLRKGDPLTISDGARRWCQAIFDDIPTLTGDIIEVPPPSPLITIGFVVPKGDRPTWIVQKLTEVGVDEIHLLSSARSVVKWDEHKSEQQRNRLMSVAREAAMQSRQVQIPVIRETRNVTEALSMFDASLAHRGGGQLALERPIIYIGPEGGWEPSETVDRPTVSLGPSVLRAETAAVTAGSVLALLRSNLLDNYSP
jgi:16S rRNA (uracil1498-N3)-methyltransferase